MSAGEDSRLDANVALIDAGRARNQLALLVDQLLEAKSRLAELLQWPAESLPMPVGELDTPVPLPPLSDVLTSARERTLVKSLYAKEAAAQNKLDLERGALPDVTVGFGVCPRRPGTISREGHHAHAHGAATALQAKRRQCRPGQADRMRAQSDREAGEREVEASVRAMAARAKTCSAAYGRFATRWCRLSKTTSVCRKALREGELSLAQQVLINRQLLDGRRDLLEAVSDCA